MSLTGYPTLLNAILLQAVPPSALVLAMALAYLLGFSGMLLAWLNYRKRKGGKPPEEKR